MFDWLKNKCNQCGNKTDKKDSICHECFITNWHDEGCPL